MVPAQRMGNAITLLDITSVLVANVRNATRLGRKGVVAQRPTAMQTRSAKVALTCQVPVVPVRCAIQPQENVSLVMIIQDVSVNLNFALHPLILLANALNAAPGSTLIANQH